VNILKNKFLIRLFLIILFLTLPWVVNGSGSDDNLSSLNAETLGKYQSEPCKYSIFEFLIENFNNDFRIDLDKPASINCFSKINSADIINGQNIVYLGTNLNIDLIIQASFWLLIFSFIPKSKKKLEIKYKDISIFVILGLLIIHFLAESDYYYLNSKIYTTDFKENYLFYSLILSFYIFLKLFTNMLEERFNNILYCLPYFFLISSAFSSSNLNFILICFMLIGATALFNNNSYKIFLVGYLGLLFLWIQNISNEFLLFDVDKLKGYSSTSFNSGSIFFWSSAFFLSTVGIFYLSKSSIKNLDLIKIKFNFLLSGGLIVLFSIISAVNPVINFLTYFYLGLNKTASKTFESVAGNAWRGISPSAESIGEFFALIILITVLICIYENNFKLSTSEFILLIINCYGLLKSNNFAAFISLISVIILFFILLKVNDKKLKFSFIFATVILFPVIYFSLFNTYSIEESSRKMLKESFAISNIEYLENNEYGLNPIDQNRFYEVIINGESKENISTSLNYLVNSYHFSKRNYLPNSTSLISSIASPINRSEKWGVFFGKFNPSFQNFLIGTSPNNIVNYYLGHASKSNIGLVLPHSSVFSFLIYFGLIGILTIFLGILVKLIRNKSNIFYLSLIFFYALNLLKSDSLLYLNSFLLFCFILNSETLFNYQEKHSEK
jgi:hypothetical protein